MTRLTRSAKPSQKFRSYTAPRDSVRLEFPLDGSDILQNKQSMRIRMSKSRSKKEQQHYWHDYINPVKILNNIKNKIVSASVSFREVYNSLSNKCKNAMHSFISFMRSHAVPLTVIAALLLLAVDHYTGSFKIIGGIQFLWQQITIVTGMASQLFMVQNGVNMAKNAVKGNTLDTNLNSDTYNVFARKEDDVEYGPEIGPRFGPKNQRIPKEMGTQLALAPEYNAENKQLILAPQNYERDFGITMAPKYKSRMKAPKLRSIIRGGAKSHYNDAFHEVLQDAKKPNFAKINNYDIPPAEPSFPNIHKIPPYDFNDMEGLHRPPPGVNLFAVAAQPFSMMLKSIKDVVSGLKSSGENLTNLGVSQAKGIYDSALTRYNVYKALTIDVLTFYTDPLPPEPVTVTGYSPAPIRDNYLTDFKNNGYSPAPPPPSGTYLTDYINNPYVPPPTMIQQLKTFIEHIGKKGNHALTELQNLCTTNGFSIQDSRNFLYSIVKPYMDFITNTLPLARLPVNIQNFIIGLVITAISGIIVGTIYLVYSKLKQYFSNGNNNTKSLQKDVEQIVENSINENTNKIYKQMSDDAEIDDEIPDVLTNNDAKNIQQVVSKVNNSKTRSKSKTSKMM